MTHIARANLDRVSRIKVARDVGRDLEKILRRFIDFRLEKPLKTVDFLRKIDSRD